jgi:ribonuclease HII
MTPTLSIEQALWADGFRHVAGIDEAGRGCLAGPVVAAAVVLPRGLTIPGVDDSKKLSPQKRVDLLGAIQEQALAVGVGLCTPAEIDALNILWAAMEAMRRAAASLEPAADYLLIDGNRCFPDAAWPYRTLVKGDSRSQTIAAASIVAKTTRDRMMEDLHVLHPHYGWARNAGYPTRAHYDALDRHGPTLFHRQSFRLTR